VGPNPSTPAPPSADLPPGDLLVQALSATSVSLATDGVNRCVAGGFGDELQVASRRFTSRGQRDIFVAHWVGEEPSWAFSLGGAGDEWATGVALGPNGSCVIAGLFRDVVSLAGTELHAVSSSPLFEADPPGQYSAFVARVSQGQLVNATDDLLSAAPERAVLQPRAGALGPIDLGNLVGNGVVVSEAQVIQSPRLELGASVGVSRDATGRVTVALPARAGVRIGTPDELNNPGSFPTGLQCLKPDLEFALCAPAATSPRQDCISSGQDAATGSAFSAFCLAHPACCGQASWTDACARDFRDSTNVCQCAALSALFNPPSGGLPKQSTCCNTVTESVCQLRPRCCLRKWDSSCALLAASAQPLCE